MAPVALPANVGPLLQRTAADIDQIVDLLVNQQGVYNWIPPSTNASAAIDDFCTNKLRDKALCDAFIHKMVDTSIMNTHRFPTALTWTPSGSGWRTWVYYYTMINSKNYTLYDYGPTENMQIYGQKDAPQVPIENYNIPTAMMSGDEDSMADPKDVEWITQTLGDKVVFSKQYHLNHEAFCIAKDMSFFSVDAVNLLNQYNPVSNIQELFLS